MTTNTALSPGDWARFTGHYQWCGREQHGLTGVILDLTPTPPGIVPGDVIAGVRPYNGQYTDGTPAFGPVVPLPLDELEAADSHPNRTDEYRDGGPGSRSGGAL
jgi:hypothetical protein